jgi:uncharacterized protein
MRLKLHHTSYLSRKIAKDLMHCDFVEIRKEIHSIEDEIEKILDEDIENELDLEDKVNEILENQEENIEFYNADYKQLFWMTKKRLANEHNVILNSEDRFKDIAHKISGYLWDEDYIHFIVSENLVNNVIFTSIETFLKGFDEADEIVHEKIQHYKRKLIPGTEDYDLVYQRLYEEELVRKGLI